MYMHNRDIDKSWQAPRADNVHKALLAERTNKLQRLLTDSTARRKDRIQTALLTKRTNKLQRLRTDSTARRKDRIQELLTDSTARRKDRIQGLLTDKPTTQRTRTRRNLLRFTASSRRGTYFIPLRPVYCEPVWPSGKALGW